MDNIRRRAPPPTPLTTTASVDTVELYHPWPKRGLRALIEEETGRRAHIKRCGRWGVRSIHNRPTIEVLLGLSRIMARDRQCVIHRCDIAIDFYMASEAEADALTAWIDKYIALKWRSSKTRKMEFKTTVYACGQTRGRNSALYRKRAHIVRFELRFYRAGTARRAGLDDPGTIAAVNPRALFDHHFTARRFTERHKIKVMRQAAAEERKLAATRVERRHSKRTRQFLGGYRASIPRRARYVLEQIQAQNMGGMRGTENVSLDFLMIPDHLTWPALKSQGNLGEGAKVGAYYGREIGKGLNGA